MTPNDTIHAMILALQWVRFLDNIRYVRRELSCAGFNEDDIDQYAECAVDYIKQHRTLSGGLNQITSEKPYED